MAEHKITADDLLDPSIRNALKTLIKEESANLQDYSGVNNSFIQEMQPIYDQSTNEVIYKGKTNSFIVLGADRYAGRGSGYGGSNFSACAAIDLVAGHMGLKAINNWNGVEAKASKNFQLDAARIYITQMADIDKYFGIPEYKVTINETDVSLENSVANSAIGIKADCVRIFGRENIKLVTKHLDTNSKNNDVTPGGIDIVAGCDIGTPAMQPQPMVKGDNLVDCLRAILNMISKLQEEISNFRDKQGVYNSYMLSHTHASGMDITLPPTGNEGAKSLLDSFINFLDSLSYNNYSAINEIDRDYLSTSSAKSVRSFYNKVN